MEPDKENRQEELCATAAAAPRSKRRSSILKDVSEMTHFIDEQTQLVDQTNNTSASSRRKSKRVSFAETKKIKVFQSGTSDGTEWNSSYAALVSSSSSDSSGAATTLDAGHDSTHGERRQASLTDQPQQLPVAADETARHRLQDSQQPFQNEYEVDVDATNFDDDDAGSSSNFLSCFLNQQPSRSQPSLPYGEPSGQDIYMTCAASSDDIQNSDNNQRKGGGHGDLDVTCIIDTDMEMTCAVSVQCRATQINSRAEAEASTVESDDMELTSAVSLVHNSRSQACLTAVGTGAPKSLSGADQGIADLEMTCTASNAAEILSYVADNRLQPARVLTAAMPSSQTLQSSGPWVENEDTQGLADMEFTCAVPSLHKLIPCESVKENEDTRVLADLELTWAVPNLHHLKSNEAIEGNDDTRGLADMELTCAVPNLYKLNPSAVSSENEDTSGLADVELTCVVPNLHKLKPSAISAENEDTRGLADMELTCAVPNLHKLKPSAVSAENEDTRGLADVELPCMVPNLHKLKPSAVPAESEDTRGLADMELTCAVPNLHKLKSSAVLAEEEDSKTFLDMEPTCSTSNLFKISSIFSEKSTDGTKRLITDESEATYTTSSYASIKSLSISNKDIGLTSTALNCSRTQVNSAIISGVVSQSVADSQPTLDEARWSLEDAMPRVSSGTCEFGPTQATTSNKDADVPLSSNGQPLEEEKINDRNTSKNVASIDALKTTVRRKSILSTKTKYNSGEKSVCEDDRTVQFCMDLDVYEMSRASVMSDVAQDHTKDKCLKDSRNSGAISNHSCSRPDDGSAAAIAAQAMEAVLVTVPHSSSVTSTFMDTSDEESKVTHEPSVRSNTSCVREDTMMDSSPKSLYSIPGQLHSESRVPLAVSSKRRSSESSVISSEKVFIMSPTNEDDTRTVYRINHLEKISDPLFLLVAATSNNSGPPVAADVSERDHPSPELVEVKEELNDSNSSQEFLSNVTVHLVDSDDSLMASPEKAPNVSAGGELVATSEGPRHDDRRRSIAAAAVAMSSCRALLQSVQSAFTADTPRDTDTTNMDDIVKELNKSLSTFANTEDDNEGEESASADVQNIKLEDISACPNEKYESVLLNASIRSEQKFETAVDRSKSVRLSTTRTSFVSMDESDEKVDEIWNQEIFRDTNSQPTDRAPVANQTVLMEDDGARANVGPGDHRITVNTENPLSSENSYVAMLPSLIETAQLPSSKPCVHSDASLRTIAFDVNADVRSSPRSTDSITTEIPREELCSAGPVMASTETSMESVGTVQKYQLKSRPGQVVVNKSSVQVSSTAGGHDDAVGWKPEMTATKICQGCSPFDEVIIYKDSRDAVLLHRQGCSATLRLRHRRFSVLLALTSSEVHCTVKEAHWRPALQELQRPMARLAISTFSYCLSQSCEALRGLRVCCLDSMLEPLLCSFNAVADLLLELYSLLQRFAVQFVKDRAVLLLSGRQGALVEVSCVLRAEAAAATPRYTLLPAASSLLGCIRAASVEVAMREVNAGPRLLTRTIDAALAVVDSWQD